MNSMTAEMSLSVGYVFVGIKPLCPVCVRLAVRILQSWRRAALENFGVQGECFLNVGICLLGAVGGAGEPSGSSVLLSPKLSPQS